MCFVTEFIRQLVCSVCKALEPPYQPVSSKKISGENLELLIKRLFPHAALYISDTEYTLCHYDDVAYLLAVSQVNKIPYVPETMDCDEFAVALWGEFNMPPWGGLAIGYLWSEIHAANCVVTEDMEILFMEPQTDELNKQLASWQGVEPRLIII